MAYTVGLSLHSNLEDGQSESAYMPVLSMDCFMARGSTDCRDNERAILSTVARVHPYTLLLPHSESCTLAHSYSLYLPRNESCTFVIIDPRICSYCECCTCGHFARIFLPSKRLESVQSSFGDSGGVKVVEKGDLRAHFDQNILGTVHFASTRCVLHECDEANVDIGSLQRLIYIIGACLEFGFLLFTKITNK